MNIIHVPDVPYPSGRSSHGPYREMTHEEYEADNRAYSAWRRQYEDVLGVSHGDNTSPLVGGFPPFDFVWVGKNLYKRELEYQKHFHLADGEDGQPEVMCECGSFEFILTYGSYEIKAKCPRCGREDVVYSG